MNELSCWAKLTARVKGHQKAGDDAWHSTKVEQAQFVKQLINQHDI